MADRLAPASWSAQTIKKETTSMITKSSSHFISFPRSQSQLPQMYYHRERNAGKKMGVM